jgi:HEAT repeat protein
MKQDEGLFVAAYAAEALGKIGDPKAIPILIEAVEEDDDYLRTDAADALETFGPGAKAAIPALVRVLKSGKAHCCFVANALGAVDEEGISVPALTEALGDESPQMRRFAAYGLSRMGGKAGPAEEALHDGLQDSDLGARIAAAQAHWSVSGKADESVDVLRSVLRAPPTWIVQVWAANALAHIGPDAKAAVPELIACLDNEHAASSAVAALGKIGPNAALAVPALVARLAACDRDYCRACIARALRRVDRSAKSLPMLRDILKDSRDSMALSEAAEAIAEIGPEAEQAVPLLRPLLKDRDSGVRSAAAKALDRIENP